MNFCCPRCRAPVKLRAEGYECGKCQSCYPIVAGIPDFRIYPDPYIDLEADRKKGLHLQEKAAELDFAGLVAYYYSITPEVPPDRASHYLSHHVNGVERGKGMLGRLQAYGLLPDSPEQKPVLDLGCGTGGFIAASSFQQIVGVDIAFRWLIVCRKRLEELGRDTASLVCACADYLPFPDDSFALITAEGLIEHIADTNRLFSEIARVSLPQAAFMARTVNRFALAPEPHVGVWGVGFLPRSAMNRYVQWRRGLAYEHIYLQSYFELASLLRKTSQNRLKVRVGLLRAVDFQHHPPLWRRLGELYVRLSQNVIFRPLLTLFGPFLDVVSVSMRNKAHGNAVNEL
jgi:ubiquinone/menaquinone biosynthesis C-methylase UbiE